MLHGMGIETGVDLGKLSHAAEFIAGVLNRPSTSKVAAALSKGGIASKKKNHGLS